jgi:hypothetical protein
MSPAVDDEDPDKSPVSTDENGPNPTRRQEDQDTSTKGDLPGDSVQPGINEASDDPN